MRKAPSGTSRLRPPSSISKARRVVSLFAFVAAVGLLAAACAAGPAPGVASVGSTTSTTELQSSPAAGNGAGATAAYRSALTYVNCMRAHGEANMPDPQANGTLNVKFATGGKDGGPATSGIDRNSPQYTAADKTCRPLLPNGGQPTPAETEQALAKGLRFAQCMRSHGVSNYPDPNPKSPGVVRLLGLDPSSPQFQSAAKVCETLVPGSGAK